MSSSVSNFIKTHRCLCMMTLGIAIVAYLGYRVVVVIKDKCCPTTTKTKAVAKNVLDQSATPPVPQKDPFANLTSIQHVAKKVLDHVYDEFTGAIPSVEPFAFRIFAKDHKEIEKATLYLEYTEAGTKIEKPLTEIIDAVAWQALDKKWEKIKPKQLDAYKSKAKILTVPTTTHEHPFLYAYLGAYYHYTNKFLRFGKINCLSAFIDAFSSLKQMNQTIHCLATEIFFMCAATAGVLQSLPSSDTPVRVCRKMGHTNAEAEKIYKVGQYVVEKAFTSTSKNENCNFGNIKLIITRLGKQSCAKEVEHFQSAGNKFEQEILFPPFTRFKITQVEKGTSYTSTSVHMEEVAS